MQTRCPFRQCQLVFDIIVNAGDPPPRTANCPTCRRLISVKPLDVWQIIDRQSQRHEEALTLANPQMLTAATLVATADSRRSTVAAGEPSRYGISASLREARSAISPLPQLIAVLEDVRSLWNVGSIFRSADGAGAQFLLWPGITGTPPRKEIAKTTHGAEDSVSWLYCASVTDVSAELKQLGYTFIGLEVTAGLPGIADSIDLGQALAATPLTKPVCLLVGNEVTGLSMEALQCCDLICSLPMRGVKESLNVAVAFGIASYMIAQQLLQSGNRQPEQIGDKSR